MGARFPFRRGCYANDTLRHPALQQSGQRNNALLSGLLSAVLEETNLNVVVGLEWDDLCPLVEPALATQEARSKTAWAALAACGPSSQTSSSQTDESGVSSDRIVVGDSPSSAKKPIGTQPHQPIQLTVAGEAAPRASTIQIPSRSTSTVRGLHTAPLRASGGSRQATCPPSGTSMRRRPSSASEWEMLPGRSSSNGRELASNRADTVPGFFPRLLARPHHDIHRQEAVLFPPTAGPGALVEGSVTGARLAGLSFQSRLHSTSRSTPPPPRT